MTILHIIYASHLIVKSNLTNEKEVIKVALKKIREEYNLSQIEVAQIIKASQKQVSRIENGESQLSLAEFGRLKKALDLNADYFEKLINYAMETDVPRKRKKQNKL